MEICCREIWFIWCKEIAQFVYRLSSSVTNTFQTYKCKNKLGKYNYSTMKIMFFVALSFLETVCVIHMTGWQWCLQSLWIDWRDERIDSRDERPQKRDAAENIQPINKVWRWGAMNKKYQQAPKSNNKLKQKIFRQWTINIIGKLWKSEEDEQN